MSESDDKLLVIEHSDAQQHIMLSLTRPDEVISVTSVADFLSNVSAPASQGALCDTLLSIAEVPRLLPSLKLTLD